MPTIDDAKAGISFSPAMILALRAGLKTQTRRIVAPQPPGDYISHGNPERITRSGKGINPSHYFCDNGTGKSRAVIYPDGSGENYDDKSEIRCRYGPPGSYLWVKEKLIAKQSAYGRGVAYAADGLYGCPNWRIDTGWRPDGSRRVQSPAWPWKRDSLAAMYMPRRACRTLLKVKSIRVERLQDISAKDAIKEGIQGVPQLGILRTSGWRDYSGKSPGFLDARESYRTLWESINGVGSWSANPWVWVISFELIHVTASHATDAAGGGKPQKVPVSLFGRGRTSGRNRPGVARTARKRSGATRARP